MLLHRLASRRSSVFQRPQSWRIVPRRGVVEATATKIDARNTSQYVIPSFDPVDAAIKKVEEDAKNGFGYNERQRQRWEAWNRLTAEQKKQRLEEKAVEFEKLLESDPHWNYVRKFFPQYRWTEEQIKAFREKQDPALKDEFTEFYTERIINRARNLPQHPEWNPRGPVPPAAAHFLRVATEEESKNYQLNYPTEEEKQKLLQELKNLPELPSCHPDVLFEAINNETTVIEHPAYADDEN